jgi:hypothetical protein
MELRTLLIDIALEQPRQSSRRDLLVSDLHSALACEKGECTFDGRPGKARGFCDRLGRLRTVRKSAKHARDVFRPGRQLIELSSTHG